MIAPFLCMLLPVMNGCSSFVDYVPTIRQLETDQRYFNGKTVHVTGRVKGFDEWHSRNGRYWYQVFYICDGGDCVHVFTQSRSSVRNGQQVSARGPYFRAYRTARVVYHNEIEATEILSGE